MAVFLLAAALAASLPQAPPAAGPTAPAPQPARVTTGAAILPYAIESDPPADRDLDLDRQSTDRGAPDSFGRRSPARQATDEALDQAFEEAVDDSRFGGPH